jgi:hypothetical protein
MLSRPYTSRIADQSLIKSANGKTYVDLIYATRDENKSYAMIYLPQNKPVNIDLGKITGSEKNTWWFDPTNGKAIAGKKVKSGTQTFTPPKQGKDWVLVIDDASKNFKAPGN